MSMGTETAAISTDTAFVLGVDSHVLNMADMENLVKYPRCDST